MIIFTAFRQVCRDTICINNSQNNFIKQHHDQHVLKLFVTSIFACFWGPCNTQIHVSLSSRKAIMAWSIFWTHQDVFISPWIAVRQLSVKLMISLRFSWKNFLSDMRWKPVDRCPLSGPMSGSKRTCAFTDGEISLPAQRGECPFSFGAGSPGEKAKIAFSRTRAELFPRFSRLEN